MTSKTAPIFVPATTKQGISLYVDCFPVAGGSIPLAFERLIEDLVGAGITGNELLQAIKDRTRTFPAHILVRSTVAHAETFVAAVTPIARNVTAGLPVSATA